MSDCTCCSLGILHPEAGSGCGNINAVWEAAERKSRRKLVVQVEFRQSKYGRIGAGQNRLRLSCGHVQLRQASHHVPIRTRCRECRQ
jgi:hypothetical protein